MKSVKVIVCHPVIKSNSVDLEITIQIYDIHVVHKKHGQSV